MRFPIECWKNGGDCLILSSRLRRGHAASFGVCQLTITFKAQWCGVLRMFTRVHSPSRTRRLNPPNEHGARCAFLSARFHLQIQLTCILLDNRDIQQIRRLHLSDTLSPIRRSTLHPPPSPSAVLYAHRTSPNISLQCSPRHPSLCTASTAHTGNVGRLTRGEHGG